MNRIFHARIMWYQYALLAVIVANTFYFVWHKQAIVAGVLMLLLVIIIEQIIHTTYTFTADGRLILYYGRFIPRREIPVRAITQVSTVRQLPIGRRHCLTRSLLIEYGNRRATVVPVKEQEFINYIIKQREP